MISSHFKHIEWIKVMKCRYHNFLRIWLPRISQNCVFYASNLKCVSIFTFKTIYPQIFLLFFIVYNSTKISKKKNKILRSDHKITQEESWYESKIYISLINTTKLMVVVFYWSKIMIRVIQSRHSIFTLFSKFIQMSFIIYSFYIFRKWTVK